MPFLAVGVLAILVGVAVYVGTVRSEPREPAAIGFGDGAEATNVIEPGPAPGYTYLQVSTLPPALRERIQGAVGLLVLIGVSAAALALALYEAGHLVNRTIEAFLD